MKYVSSILLSLLGFILISCSGINIYVSNEGNDQNDGSKNKPVATLQKAQELAREKAGQEVVNIFVENGIYYLPNTLVFKPNDLST